MLRKLSLLSSNLGLPLTDIQGKAYIFDFDADQAETELSKPINYKTLKWLIRKSSVHGLITISHWLWCDATSADPKADYKLRHRRVVIKDDKSWTFAPSDKAEAEKVALTAAHALHMLETDQECGDNLLLFLELNFANGEATCRTMADLLVPAKEQASKEYGYVMREKGRSVSSPALIK